MDDMKLILFYMFYRLVILRKATNSCLLFLKKCQGEKIRLRRPVGGHARLMFAPPNRGHSSEGGVSPFLSHELVRPRARSNSLASLAQTVPSLILVLTRSLNKASKSPLLYAQRSLIHNFRKA